jgi:hypothetical protein
MHIELQSGSFERRGKFGHLAEDITEINVKERKCDVHSRDSEQVAMMDAYL